MPKGGVSTSAFRTISKREGREPVRIRRIRGRIVLAIVLVGCIPLVIGLGLAYVSGMQSLRDVIGGNLQAVAVQAADRVTMLVQGEERASVLVDGPTVMSTHMPDRLQAL